MIVGAFETAAKQVVCNEAILKTIEASLSRKAAAFVLTAAATPMNHPIQTTQKRFYRKAAAYRTAWAATCREHENRLRRDQGKIQHCHLAVKCALLAFCCSHLRFKSSQFLYAPLHSCLYVGHLISQAAQTTFPYLYPSLEILDLGLSIFLQTLHCTYTM